MVPYGTVMACVHLSDATSEQLPFSSGGFYHATSSEQFSFTSGSFYHTVCCQHSNPADVSPCTLSGTIPKSISTASHPCPSEAPSQRKPHDQYSAPNTVEAARAVESNENKHDTESCHSETLPDFDGMDFPPESDDFTDHQLRGVFADPIEALLLPNQPPLFIQYDPHKFICQDWLPGRSEASSNNGNVQFVIKDNCATCMHASGTHVYRTDNQVTAMVFTFMSSSAL